MKIRIYILFFLLILIICCQSKQEQNNHCVGMIDQKFSSDCFLFITKQDSRLSFLLDEVSYGFDSITPFFFYSDGNVSNAVPIIFDTNCNVLYHTENNKDTLIPKELYCYKEWYVKIDDKEFNFNVEDELKLEDRSVFKLSISDFFYYERERYGLITFFSFERGFEGNYLTCVAKPNCVIEPRGIIFEKYYDNYSSYSKRRLL